MTDDLIDVILFTMSNRRFKIINWTNLRNINRGKIFKIKRLSLKINMLINCLNAKMVLTAEL